MTMTLKEYKDKNNMSYSKLAKLIGVAHATVARRYCLPKEHKDHMIPNSKFMVAIMTATDGAVTPNDFYTAQKW
tara:strand:+ start:596 stop:817 length:222 start_codon:yes stop_codon:yes gene_type:complete